MKNLPFLHRQARLVSDFRKAWVTACKKVNVRRLFHYLRRSACRKMLAAGVQQSISMKLPGHKTDSILRRYSIVAESDLRTAIRRTQDYLRTTTQVEAVIPTPKNAGVSVIAGAAAAIFISGTIWGQSCKGGRVPSCTHVIEKMVRPERFELPTFWFVARRSIQLS